jgi:Domain of unknown function (DUF4408)
MEQVKSSHVIIVNLRKHCADFIFSDAPLASDIYQPTPLPLASFFHSLYRCPLSKIPLSILDCINQRFFLTFIREKSIKAMANSRRNSDGFLSPSMALKISLVVVAAVSLFVLARLTIPHISSLLSVALPQIWALLSAWLAPPYLFITVHFIILVIWKLSDHKPSQQWAPHQDHQQVVKPKRQLSREISPEIPRDIPTRGYEWAQSGEESMPQQNLPVEESPAISQEEQGYYQRAAKEEQSLPKQRLSRVISPKISREFSHRVSPSDESCLTEEKSEEKSTASSHLEMRRSEKPKLASETEIVRRLEPEVEEPAVVEEGEVDVDDSMDATWKAIMAKTPRPVVPTPSRATEPESSIGADEMNRRFEDFIKKSRDQIRLQVEESNRHVGRFAMANAAF